MSIVFLSHAAADGKLAQRLSALLRLGCNLGADEIFCTSVEGSNLTTGENFPSQIHDRLLEAKIVVMLVTPMWWHKPFCVAEAGGAWALKKPVFPLIVRGVSREMGAQMLGTQTRALDSSGLSDLRDKIAEVHEKAKTPTPQWNFELDMFLNDLERLVDGLEKPDTVSRAEFDEALAERQAAYDAVRLAREENAALQELIGQLRNAKDREEVRAIELRHAGIEEAFDTLCENVKNALRSLSTAEEEVLFATMAGREWIPPSDLQTFEPDVLRRLRDGGRATPSGNGWEADRDDPVMDHAASMVEEFRKFFTEHGDELEPLIRERYSVKPSLDNKRFWEYVFDATFI